MRQQRFKKLFSLLLCLCVLVLEVKASSDLPQPELQAVAALLADASTGEILYAKEIDTVREPASLTKIMTLMLALEDIGDDWDARKEDIVTVSQAALADITSDASNVGMKVGEEMRLEDLLYCVMLASANEGANVLAEYTSSSIENFISRMNERAKELGCENTFFVNPHGLPSGGKQVTTARDLLRITTQALRTPHFMEIVNTQSHTVPANNLSAARALKTSNSLISQSKTKDYFYPFAKGIKTGNTNAAGYCLVSTAQQDDVQFISVVLGSAKTPKTRLFGHFLDTKALFEWGFDNFETKKLLDFNEIVGNVPVSGGIGFTEIPLIPEEEVFALMRKTIDPTTLERTIDLFSPQGAEAPIAKGQILGTLSFSLDGQVYANVNLLAAQDVEPFIPETTPVLTPEPAPTLDPIQEDPKPKETKNFLRTPWPYLIVLGIAFIFLIILIYRVKHKRSITRYRGRRLLK